MVIMTFAVNLIQKNMEFFNQYCYYRYNFVILASKLPFLYGVTFYVLFCFILLCYNIFSKQFSSESEFRLKKISSIIF